MWPWATPAPPPPPRPPAWWTVRPDDISHTWASQQPSALFLLEYLLVLSLASIAGTLAFKRLRQPTKFLESCGVSVRKVQRTMQEIDRKTFHLATLLVPIVHQTYGRHVPIPPAFD